MLAHLRARRAGYWPRAPPRAARRGSTRRVPSGSGPLARLAPAARRRPRSRSRPRCPRSDAARAPRARATRSGVPAGRFRPPASASPASAPARAPALPTRRHPQMFSDDAPVKPVGSPCTPESLKSVVQPTPWMPFQAAQKPGNAFVTAPPYPLGNTHLSSYARTLACEPICTPAPSYISCNSQKYCQPSRVILKVCLSNVCHSGLVRRWPPSRARPGPACLLLCARLTVVCYRIARQMSTCCLVLYASSEQAR